MTTQEAIDFFGGRRKLSEALEIWPNQTYTWKEHPPIGRQYQIEVLTNGQLKAERSGGEKK